MNVLVDMCRVEIKRENVCVCVRECEGLEAICVACDKRKKERKKKNAKQNHF